MTDFVFINAIIEFFNDQPILVLCFLYLLVYYKALKPIKVALNNHITDLKAGQKELKAENKELNDKIQKLEIGQNELNSRLGNIEAGQKRLESTINTLKK